LLQKLIAQHGASCWLVNTGWTGGAYGTGQRMSITHTRALLRAALAGELDSISYRRDPFFGLQIPEHVDGIPDNVLDPRAAWSDRAAYDAAAASLVKRFEANFASFVDLVDDDIKAAAIRAAA
jgi:phosphoenolpyruvate carboxykinase (ATP)